MTVPSSQGGIRYWKLCSKTCVYRVAVQAGKIEQARWTRDMTQCSGLTEVCHVAIDKYRPALCGRQRLDED